MIGSNPKFSNSDGERWKRLGWLLVGSILYYGLAKFGMIFFSWQPSNITLLWLPSGIGLVMYLWGGFTALPFIFFASFASNFSGMAMPSLEGQILHTSIAAAADSFGAWFAALMVKRFLPNGLNRLENLFSLLVFVCFLPTFSSAIAISANLVAGHYISRSDGPFMIAMLVFADSLGILLIYPMFDSLQNITSLPAQDWCLALWGILTSVVLIYLSFNNLPGLIYFVIPLILYLVFHIRSFFVYLSLIFVICLTVVFASKMSDSFNLNLESPEKFRFMLQCFLLTTVLLTVGMILQQKELINSIKSEQKWQDLANHDALTSLMNRHSFIPLLEREIFRARYNHTSFTVAMVDVDRFKQINDTYGHEVGDIVLTTLAKRFQELTRGIDSVARLGGDEFTFLLSETTLDEARIAMERVRVGIEQLQIPTCEGTLSVTISVGLAEWNRVESRTVNETLKLADRLLYEAKYSGRNIVKG